MQSVIARAGSASTYVRRALHFGGARGSRRNVHMERLTPYLGCEVTGGLSMLEESHDAVYDLLQEHHVVFFRDAPLTPKAHMALARSLGPVEPPHPIYPKVSAEGFPDSETITVLENDAERPPDTAEWHQDCTFSPSPPWVSVLRSVTTPVVGGDTLWLSAFAALEALPCELQRELENLSAVHDMGSFRNNFATAGDAHMTQKTADIGSAVHPVVALHPKSGAKYLNVNESFTTFILGMSKPDSDLLLQRLFTHLRKPEFQVRLRWKPNTVVLWQNYGIQHYAVADYMPHYRCMHRVTVLRDGRLEASMGAKAE